MSVGGGKLGAYTAAAAAAAHDPAVAAAVGHAYLTLLLLPLLAAAAGAQVWGDQYSSLLSRMAFSEGSFFDEGKVPAADSNSCVYAMRQILHDWSDADGIAILKQVCCCQLGSLGCFAAIRVYKSPCYHFSVLTHG